jgi:hypothetical protein
VRRRNHARFRRQGFLLNDCCLNRARHNGGVSSSSKNISKPASAGGNSENVQRYNSSADSSKKSLLEDEDDDEYENDVPHEHQGTPLPSGAVSSSPVLNSFLVAFSVACWRSLTSVDPNQRRQEMTPFSLKMEYARKFRVTSGRPFNC